MLKHIYTLYVYIYICGCVYPISVCIYCRRAYYLCWSLVSAWQTYTILMIANHLMDISPVRVHPCRLVSVSKRPQCPSLNHNQGSVGTSELKLGRTSQSEWWSFTEQHVGYWPTEIGNWTANIWTFSNKKTRFLASKILTEAQLSAVWEDWWSLSSLLWLKQCMTVAWRIDNG
jgi:hypothetical protein